MHPGALGVSAPGASTSFALLALDENESQFHLGLKLYRLVSRSVNWLFRWVRNDSSEYSSDQSNLRQPEYARHSNAKRRLIVTAEPLPFLKTGDRYKAIILFTLISLLHGCSASSRTATGTLVGRWEGVAEIPGKKTRVIVDFTQNAKGFLIAAISVPDERLLGKPLINVRDDPPKLHFELQTSERKIIFDGSRQGEDISGTVGTGEISSPLSLRHTSITPPTP